MVWWSNTDFTSSGLEEDRLDRHYIWTLKYVPRLQSDLVRPLGVETYFRHEDIGKTSGVERRVKDTLDYESSGLRGFSKYLRYLLQWTKEGHRG